MQTKPAGTHRHAHTTKEADRQSPRIATTKTAAEHPTITQLQDVRAPLMNRVAVLQGARPQRFEHILQDAETVAGGDREPTGGQRRTFSASFGSFSTNCVTQYASCWWNALMFRGLCSGMSAFCKNVLCSSCWPSWKQIGRRVCGISMLDFQIRFWMAAVSDTKLCFRSCCSGPSAAAQSR